MSTARLSRIIKSHAFSIAFLSCLFLISPANNSFAQQTQPSSGETTVNDSVLYSLHNHPIIKGFQEYREASYHDVGKARSGWFPKLDGRVGYGPRQYSSPASRVGGYDDDWENRFDGELILTQTLWDGLATASRVDINTAKLNSASSRLFDNSESIALDAVLAHIEVLREYELLALAQDNVKTHERILASQQERLASGVDTMADVTQTQARLAQAQTTLVGIEADLQMALANYTRITGMPAESLMPVGHPNNAPASFEEALMAAQTTNPKLAAFMSDIEAADSEIGLAKSGYHPVIYAEAGTRYMDHVDDSLSWSRGYTALIRMDWNLFNGLYDYYNIKASTSRSRQARSDYQDTYEQLAQDTKDTWARLEATRQQIRFYSSAVEYNRQTTSMYWEQFNLGSRSLLDVLNSENEMFSNSMQLVTANMNETGSYYRLLALGGRMLESMGIPNSEFEKQQLDAPLIMRNSPVSQDKDL